MPMLVNCVNATGVYKKNWNPSKRVWSPNSILSLDTTNTIANKPLGAPPSTMNRFYLFLLIAIDFFFHYDWFALQHSLFFGSYCIQRQLANQCHCHTLGIRAYRSDTGEIADSQSIILNYCKN